MRVICLAFILNCNSREEKNMDPWDFKNFIVGLKYGRAFWNSHLILGSTGSFAIGF